MTGERKTPAGWLSLYALAFGLMLAAAALFGVALITLLRSTNLLWVSAALSGLTIAAAIASVVLPRRR